MTAQICDRIIFADRKHTIAASTGTPFHPRSVGLKVTHISTACRAGYHCDFTVSGDNLFLSRLTVGLAKKDRLAAESGTGPEMFGVLPKRELRPCERYDPKTKQVTPDTYWSDWFYEPPDYPIQYSGTLTVGHDFIQELYVHAGKQAAYKYRQVNDLVFQGGKLVNVVNRTEEMQRVREQREVQSNQPLLSRILNAVFGRNGDPAT